MRDAAVGDAPMRDAAVVACVMGGCDDGNVCTDDTCVPATGCTHTPNAATCVDGVLCNGDDTCGGGTCSVHDHRDPCPGASTCSAATDMCTGCAGASDCPLPMVGEWSACEFAAGDVCVTTGNHTRTRTTYACLL